MLAGVGGAIVRWPGWFDDGGPTLAVGVLGVGYTFAAGAIRFRHARAVTNAQLACFFAGFFVLAVALVSPLEPLSERLFSAHMTQHLLLATVAPPLLVLGAPRTQAIPIA